MGKAKKSFIDRKNAVTFHVVHRSQHDPLITDESAPQHVLVESTSKEVPTPTKVETDKTKRVEQQRKYGVFFDDEYNYLQHLKEHGKDHVVWECVENPNQQRKKEKPKIILPSSVFESEFKEDEGMLNKAAPRPGPRPDWDPDIVAALDDDFDFEDPNNAIEDDFVTKAMEEGEDDYFDENDEDDESDDGEGYISSDNLGDDSDQENEDELMDRLAPLMRERRFSDEETKSRFTEYSMSSSVIRRNEQLSLLDDRFEKFFESYDDPEVGPLDMEDIDGHIGPKHPLVRQCIKEMKKGKDIEKYSKEWDIERVKHFKEIHNGSDDELVEIEVDDEKKKKWDCESILSTYSNLYNHPKVIKEIFKRRKSKDDHQTIQIDPKTGMPLNVLNGSDSNKLTTKTLAKFDNVNATSYSPSNDGPKSLCAKSVLSTLSVLSIRPKDETLEEKKERKRLLKEYRAERRLEKKANAEAFKEEKKRQTKIKINNQNNIQGNKIL